MPPVENRSQKIRDLNNELHALLRQKAIPAVAAALEAGEKAKTVDGRSYAIAVAACGDAGDGAGALALLRRAGARGGRCAPGVEACTAAVKAVGATDVDGAAELVKAMARAGTDHAPRHRRAESRCVDFDISGQHPHANAATINRDVRLRSGRPPRYAPTGPLTEAARPNGRTLNTLLRACLVLRRADLPKTGRGDAVAATWIFRGDESRRHRGYDVDLPWR